MKVLIVGAGFTGAVIARELANSGFKVTIIDKRNHIAGNCYTERDAETNILEHVYGPHIFHTDDDIVWDYVNSFGVFKPYINRVKSVFKNEVYSLPINLHTINQFYKKNLSPVEAAELLRKKSVSMMREPQNLEEQALSFIGKDLYEAFFKGYTLKQWGTAPDKLPASILKRLPVRFNYDDNYFSHKHQGIPLNGYTDIVNSILTHDNITIKLNYSHTTSENKDYEHIIWTGKLDEWFNFKLGNLSYRTLKFEKIRAQGDYQGAAVINYGDIDIPYTRISEHKHFAPWEKHEDTIYFKETSHECGENDIPYYPVRLVDDKILLRQYFSLAEAESKVTFAGRLGTYRYMDMDVTIKEALELSKNLIIDLTNNLKPKAFYHKEII